MNKILLFGGGLQSLSIARGLKGQSSYIINVADGHAVGKYSKYIDEFHKIDINEYDISDLIHFTNNEDIKVIIPLEDDYAIWVSKYKERIENNTNCKVASEIYEKILFVTNKHTLIEFCRVNDIPHPETIEIPDNNNYESLANFSYPALIKPDISNGSRGISLIDNYNELINIAPTITARYGSCSLQEYIDNNHYYNVMLYRYKDGTYAPKVATKITRYYPVNGGSSSYCSSISNEALFRICCNLLDNLEWHGFADFDVLESKNGDYKIIEINPRIPASINAALVSGIDFGKIIIDDLLFNRKPQMQYNPGAHLRCLGLDIAWFYASKDRFHASPSWFKFFGKRLYYQDGGIKDWRAMIYSIWSGFKKQLSPSFRKAKSGMN